MFNEEISNIINFLLDHDPAVIIEDVFSELLPSDDAIAHINKL